MNSEHENADIDWWMEDGLFGANDKADWGELNTEEDNEEQEQGTLSLFEVLYQKE